MDRLPSLFVSHGAPTFAVEPGTAGPRLRALGEALPRPRAILIISPHWMTEELTVSASAAPPTIHDFGGFPAQLYALRYPAPGDPALAGRIAELLKAQGRTVRSDALRGLDHGAWVPLTYLYPGADVPVVQLSLPVRYGAGDAYELGRLLAPLAAEGVLIIGSGSLTHNLAEFRGRGAEEAADYVRRFVSWSRTAVARGDSSAIIDYLHSAPDARRAHPTSDHYLPLPFAMGAGPPDTPGRVIDGGVVYGMLSMDAFVFGAAA
ncbi:MAG: dioxygenase [Proteobacteria bacterium]|nr:dioxygenase [Pseudomonadota bacterium]